MRESLGQEPPWNADRRARPAGCALAERQAVTDSVCRRSASFYFFFRSFRSPGERSETRGAAGENRTIVPGYRFAHPGYSAPRPIVMHRPFPLPGHPTKIENAASFLAMACRIARVRRKTHRENGRPTSFRPRENGGGGPRVVRAANVAWWRGRLTRRPTFVERIFVESRAPSTILHAARSGWSPSPTCVGEDGDPQGPSYPAAKRAGMAYVSDASPPKRPEFPDV